MKGLTLTSETVTKVVKTISEVEESPDLMSLLTGIGNNVSAKIGQLVYRRVCKIDYKTFYVTQPLPKGLK